MTVWSFAAWSIGQLFHDFQPGLARKRTARHLRTYGPDICKRFGFAFKANAQQPHGSQRRNGTQPESSPRNISHIKRRATTPS